MNRKSGGGDYALNNNIITNTIMTEKPSDVAYFCHNTLNDMYKCYLSGAFTHNYFNANSNIEFNTNYTTDGIQHNNIEHCYNLKVICNNGEMSYNTFNNVHNGANSYPTYTNSAFLSAQTINNNFITNTLLNVSCTDWNGFNNNFTHNSIISGNTKAINHTYMFASTALFSSGGSYGTDDNVMYFSKYIYEPSSLSNKNYPDVIISTLNNSPNDNFLFGTYAKNIHAVYSFTDRGWSDFTGSTGSEAVIIDSIRCFNVNDNSISAAANIAILGEKNGISGVFVGNVFGNYNRVTASIGDKSDYINILGSNNTFESDSTNVYGKQYANSNSIIGYNNTVIAAPSNGDYGAVINNTIIGDCNSLQEMSDDKLSGYVSIYNAYKDKWGLHSQSTLGTYNEYINPGTTWRGSATKGNNRNILLGSHNILSQYVNDSILIGSRNVIYNNSAVDRQQQLDKFNRITANAPAFVYGTQYKRGDVVKYNNTAYSASRDNVNYYPSNTSRWDVCNYNYGEILGVKSNNFNLGSYNFLRDGSNQINIGNCNTTSGHNSTAIGEGLVSQTSQIVIGRFNEVLNGTNGLSNEGNTTSGALFIVGNGSHKSNDYETSAVVRSNAMVVSADGTVSARRFIESEQALTITGGDFVTVTEDATNNKLVIDLESSLGQMLTELSGVLTAKPATGRHILGVDDGTLTWLEVNQ